MNGFFKKIILYRYEAHKVGVNLIKNMLPDLTETLDLPRLTNGSIRTSAIRAMKRSGFEDREVMKISGHLRAETLSNYNPVPHISKRLKMAASISNHGQEFTPKVDSEPRPSTSKERHNDIMLIASNELEVIDVDPNMEIIVEEKKNEKEQNENPSEDKENEVENSNDDLPDQVLSQGPLKSENVSTNVLALLKREQEIAYRKNELDSRRIALMEKLLDTNNK